MVKKTYLKSSGYLVSRSTFITGMGQILDTAGSYQKYNSSDSEQEADSKATLLDWIAVGDDIKAALGSFEAKEWKRYVSRTSK